MEEKLVLHIEIHQLRKRKLKVTQISNQLKICRNTVYKYLDMTYEEAVEEFSKTRQKILDPYRDRIVNWLQEFPDLSGAQIFDWLKEHNPEIDVGESTVRDYVSQIREIYQIEKNSFIRDYESVEQQPKGKQLQVDWGQTKQKTLNNKEVKLYFIAFVLAHSRYKYMEWQDRPFTTMDAIRCHENAFRFYGGCPEEIVYDQDHLLTVSENAGDLILTSEFQAYVNERKFRVHLCRKADPESKGMIENVVKYIKGNFAKHRVFKNIEDWNARGIAWLTRTGNYNVHQTIKKRPAEVFVVEKQHLQPVSPLLSEESTVKESITRNVTKDNTIRFQSNRYSVPTGTYGKQKQVFIEIVDETKLQIRLTPSNDIIAEHFISQDKGKLIKNRNHARDRSQAITTLKDKVIAGFNHELATAYIEEICIQYPRYRRDQLMILKQLIEEEPQFISSALQKCIDEKLYSANEFHDVVKYLKQEADQLNKKQVNTPPVLISNERSTIHVATRDKSIYLKAFGGTCHE